MMEGINDGIARHEDAPLGNPLRREVVVRRCGRCKMKGRDTAREPPIHLLGERRIDVMRTQSRLDMPDRNLMIVRSKRPRKGCRRITVDKHEIRAILLEYFVDAHHRSCRDVKEGLPRRHDIEVIIRHDVEKMQYLIQHLAMLRRDQRFRFDFVRMLHELHDDGRHLDRFGARAKNRHHFDFADHALFSLLSECHTRFISAARRDAKCRACERR